MSYGQFLSEPGKKTLVGADKLLTLVFWVVALRYGEGKELVLESPMLRLRHRPTDCKYG